MKKYLALTSLMLLCAPTLAANPNAVEPGFSGEIALNMGVISTNSNFDTDGSSNFGLNQSAERNSKFIAGPLGTVSYRFGERAQHQFFSGTSRDDIAVGTLAFELGYSYRTEGGMTMSWAVLPSVLSKEVWFDPYTRVGRQSTTDSDGVAYRFKVENLLQTPVTLDMTYFESSIDNEGIENADLHRSGDGYRLKGQYRYMLNRNTFIIPALSYTRFDADGKANSFDAVGVEMSFVRALGRHNFALTTAIETRKHDQGSSIFSHVNRDEKELSAFLAYQYANFMGWDNWSMVALAGYSKTDSNLAFFEEKQYLTSVGLSYKF